MADERIMAVRSRLIDMGLNDDGVAAGVELSERVLNRADALYANALATGVVTFERTDG